MTSSSKVVSANAYEPNQSTKVLNFITPSTRSTRKANQQRKNIAEYFILRFFRVIPNYLKNVGYAYGISRASSHKLHVVYTIVFVKFKVDNFFNKFPMLRM